MIQLGSFDPAITPAAREAYAQRVKDTTRVALTEVQPGCDRLAFEPCRPDARQSMTVAELQQALRRIGFFPGGQADGICGYRTLSAIRLFQEYVRSIEGQALVPDGRFGPISETHLRRWLDQGLVPDWTPAVDLWRTGATAGTEYGAWLAFLEQVKAHHAGAASPVQQKVNDFARPTDTRKVAQWDFSPDAIHLVGIRRGEQSGKFDDIFILLMKGLVFKFQGSTEPGHTKDARGFPFLVPGQHDYHFGWHQRKYLALRPRSLDRGVLVVRSKNVTGFGDAELGRGLEANASINIHWGGKGLKRDVSFWSEGCQVINGSLYGNHAGASIQCQAFAGMNDQEVDAARDKTRAAYNMLVDVVTALGSDLAGDTVRYMLLTEQDLDLDPGIRAQIAHMRTEVARASG